jgi:aryl-alcohol dehydrogenase-like predicted oxidoreductase
MLLHMGIPLHGATPAGHASPFDGVAATALDFECARTASVGAMRYTTIGSEPLSARRVSVLCLGAMRFGTTTDEATSFAILDRYTAAGGNFIDTSNNYLFFVNGTRGGESEALLGRWRASRRVGDEIVIATKVGARPVAPAADFGTPREGLSRAAIRVASERSRERLGVERIDLYYAHIPDQSGVPLQEQVAAFGELVADGVVGLLGLSNHWAWQVEREGRRAAVSPHVPAHAH